MITIMKTGSPTINTKGLVGQHYIDLDSGTEYECVDIIDHRQYKKGLVKPHDFVSQKVFNGVSCEYVWEKIGEHTSSGGVQPDWNQNDETAKDYVKNRPFWTDDPKETVLLEETELTFVGGLARLPTIVQLEEGQTYIVIYNGNKYECIAWYYANEGGVLLGNGEFLGETIGNAEPFIMTGEAMMSGDASATVKISTIIAEVHKIDAKYIDIDIDAVIGQGAKHLSFTFDIGKYPKLEIVLPAELTTITYENIDADTWREFVTLFFTYTPVWHNNKLDDPQLIEDDNNNVGIAFGLGRMDFGFGGCVIRDDDYRITYDAETRIVSCRHRSANGVYVDYVTQKINPLS